MGEFGDDDDGGGREGGRVLNGTCTLASRSQGLNFLSIRMSNPRTSKHALPLLCSGKQDL